MIEKPLFVPVDYDPFAAELEIEKVIATNDSQREIWLACAFGGDEANLAYNESISVEFAGVFHTEYFRCALNEVVLRHEALRSTISANGEALFVHRNFPTALDQVDISDQDAAAQKQYIENFIAKEIATPLSMVDGPLFKVYLHKLSSDLHLFTIVKHHVICDGWSTGIILEDLGKLYNSYVAARPAVLESAYQMSDYAANEAAFKKSAAYRETEEYWLKLYRGTVPVVSLPTDFPRLSPRSYRGRRFDAGIDLQLLQKIKAVAARTSSSLVTTLLAAFEVFVFQKTRQQELVVGLPSSGQVASGLHDVVGHCVNLLPIRASIDPQHSFQQYVTKHKTAILDAYDHQRLTFGELIKKLYIPRDSSRIPLVPVVFNIDMGMDQAVTFSGLQHTLVSNPRPYESFELFLNLTGTKTKLIFEWSYNTALFRQETIESFHAEFTHLLEQVAEKPERLIADLCSAPKHERPSVTVAQTSGANLPSFNTLFNKCVQTHLTKTAVSFNDQRLSYGQLFSNSNQLALFLSQKNIIAGDIVAVSVDRSIELLASLLAIWKIGAVYVPLDPGYPQDRLGFMLEDARAKCILISGRYKNRFKGAAREIVIDEVWGQLEHVTGILPQVRESSDDLAYILYTSGSTGKPKGVKISHGNLSNFLLSMLKQPSISENDRLLAITTISFDIAGLELFLPLIAGAEVVIADTAATKDARILSDILKEKKITILQATPSTWQMLIDSGWSGTFPLKALSGGEQLTRRLAGQLLTRCTELWNMYGPTETTIWSTIKKIHSADEAITIGHPIDNTQIYLMDEQGTPVPEGTPAEICIGGEGVGKGYLNRPELSNQKFIRDPYGPETGKMLYRTGDLGLLLEDGEFQCLGRIDQQVKIRGHRIELGEIESVLVTASGIKEAVVAYQECPGSKNKLIAYVIPDAQIVKDDALSWRERWETLYNIGAENSAEGGNQGQNLDETLLDYYENGAGLALQLEEWLQSSVERIKNLGARKIYEIGSGGGQIAYEVAPGIDYYLATDYAKTAIDKLNESLLAAPEKWSHVRAMVAAADDFSAVKDQKFDLVLIHSVAQYFLDDNYLVDVIRKSVDSIDGSGCVFIGDMQGKNSLYMCHAMDQLPKSADNASLRAFKDVVSNRVEIEDELVADPEFYYGLPTLIPKISNVNIQLRKGQSINETTKYHYDVWLFVGDRHDQVSANMVEVWSKTSDLAALETLLTGNPSHVIEVKNIPNLRTEKDYTLMQLMDSVDDTTLLKDIKARVNQTSAGMHPDAFWELAKKLNFKAHIRWTTDGTDNLFNVVFIPADLPNALPYPPVLGAAESSAGNLAAYIRVPGLKNVIRIPRKLTADWKSYCAALLPSIMVPEEFVGLDRLPLTPNGKIDRNALPKPNFETSKESAEGSVALTPAEQIVAEIWSQTLGLENLKTNDDFFELGGHSLLAMKVMVALEKKTGKRLPLATLFDHSTIQKMALQLEDELPAKKWNCIVPIKTSGKKKPLFLVHGGGLNVLVFRSMSAHFDAEQPIYGIQALGIDHPIELPPSVELMAAKYIEEMLLVEPVGPYYIAGYSLGGIFAFEMSKQLQGMGKVVKLTGVLDTYASTREDLSKTSDLLKKLLRQFYKIPFFIKSFIKHPKEAFLYQVIISKRKLSALVAAEVETPGLELSAYETEIYQHYERILSSYSLTPANVEVKLFRVEKRLYYLDDSVYLGWKTYARKGVKVYNVPGDHKTFLYTPNVEKLAEIMQLALCRS